MFERLAYSLTLANRERTGREASSTGAIFDARTAHLSGVGVKNERVYDPARRIVEGKRHAPTDRDGR